MIPRHPLARLWLLSDARNDAVLDRALEHLPRGSGCIFRHYHLAPRQRQARFDAVRRRAAACGHRIVLAGSAPLAKEWGADGMYGAPPGLAPRRRGLIYLASVHTMQELAQAMRMGADGVLISPVFPTRSHPAGHILGPLRFMCLARHSAVPVIALGGMTPAGARRLRHDCWAAIDGLSLRMQPA